VDQVSSGEDGDILGPATGSADRGVIETGDRLVVLAPTIQLGRVRAHFGDSIRGNAEFSYISVGIGMVLGLALGAIPIPIPGVGKLSLGVAAGPLMGRYSKALEYEYSANLRRELIGEAAERFAADIDVALAMLRSASEKSPLLARALRRCEEN